MAPFIDVKYTPTEHGLLIIPLTVIILHNYYLLNRDFMTFISMKHQRALYILTLCLRFIRCYVGLNLTVEVFSSGMETNGEISHLPLIRAIGWPFTAGVIFSALSTQVAYRQHSQFLLTFVTSNLMFSFSFINIMCTSSILLYDAFFPI